MFIMAFIFISSWAYAWAGRRLGGNASPEVMRTTIVWAFPASVLSALVDQLIQRLSPYMDVFILFNLNLLSIVITIWVISISIRFLSQVQGFTVLRSIGNMLLAYLVLMLPFLALGVILALVNG
jgi:hypothetical protein